MPAALLLFFSWNHDRIRRSVHNSMNRANLNVLKFQTFVACLKAKAKANSVNLYQTALKQ